MLWIWQLSHLGDSICCRSSGVIERTLDKQEKKVPKLIFWPLIILKSEWLPWHWEAFLVQVSNELDLSVESYMDMVEYTTVYRADTLDPMFC